MWRLSVVIPNYNYERFVGAAIESALALDWDDVEVVVVDDGSTDGSLGVIRRFGDRVRVVATENATQRVAVNRGFAETTGDVVIVLDSDDVLPADLPRRLAAAWGPTVSKAQFAMQRIDEDGRPQGSPFPCYDPVPGAAQIRDWQARTSAYPTAPGSGNAYARWYLDLLLPVDDRIGDSSDSALLAAAPLLGDVVTLPDVVVGYRQHGRNDSNLLGDTTRFAREVRRAVARWDFARESAPTGQLQVGALRRSRELLQLRVAALASTPEESPGLPGDHRGRMICDALIAPLHPGPETIGARLLVTLWCLLTLISPPPLASRLVELRYRR